MAALPLPLFVQIRHMDAVLDSGVLLNFMFICHSFLYRTLTRHLFPVFPYTQSGHTTVHHQFDQLL